MNVPQHKEKQNWYDVLCNQEEAGIVPKVVGVGILREINY